VHTYQICIVGARTLQVCIGYWASCFPFIAKILIPLIQSCAKLVLQNIVIHYKPYRSYRYNVYAALWSIKPLRKKVRKSRYFKIWNIGTISRDNSPIYVSLSKISKQKTENIGLQEKHWCKASKGVQARNAECEDELVDIWWQDILINFSMVNLFLPEWTDERHCSLWTLIGMLEIRILLVISLWSWVLIATDIHVYHHL
jgi:hypothetical protein